MPYETPIPIKQALKRIDDGDYVLPAIQREFVWGPDRIAKLFDSLMRGYPIGRGIDTDPGRSQSPYRGARAESRRLQGLVVAVVKLVVPLAVEYGIHSPRLDQPDELRIEQELATALASPGRRCRALRRLSLGPGLELLA